MVDDTILPGTGEVYASDDVGGVKYQRVKISVGPANSAPDDLSKAAPLPVLDPCLEIARGNVTGLAAVNKFGRNTDIDSAAAEDVWDGGGIWAAPTQARTHQITSTHADDDGDPVGDGARTIRIYGLKTWASAESSEDITLNGVANVPTINTYVIIHRMNVLTKGATNVNVGVITATADTDGTVTAQINAGEGQTQMAVYGVPSTQVAYMTAYYASYNKAGGSTGLVDVSLLANPEPDTELLNFVVKHTEGLLGVGASGVLHPFNPYAAFAGPAILKMRAAVSVNDADVSAGFDLILVDN